MTKYRIVQFYVSNNGLPVLVDAKIVKNPEEIPVIESDNIDADVGIVLYINNELYEGDIDTFFYTYNFAYANMGDFEEDTSVPLIDFLNEKIDELCQ